MTVYGRNNTGQSVREGIRKDDISALDVRFVILFVFCTLFSTLSMKANDGYDLWLRYEAIEDASLKADYREMFRYVLLGNGSETIDIVGKELNTAFTGLLEQPPVYQEALAANTGLIIGTIGRMEVLESYISTNEKADLGDEGYILKKVVGSTSNRIVVAGKDDIGTMYGMFHFLRLIQTGFDFDSDLDLTENPAIDLRVLNHWDNLDRTVERGYAGFSIWNWHELPEVIDQRYIDYARANASIGINGAVVTNVNANALVFRPDYLKKVKALADVFRPYGISIYLTARFSSPIELGGLNTADPLSPEVIKWWTDKVAEIYQLIPDFGGFLVKANSEGQPGPQDYGRTHADGANMLAEALDTFGGVVMWRAFVYSAEEPEDRAKQAFNEFLPLDGLFHKNVLVQVKNGPIDFQPREPIHPLFGAMPKTPLMMEFQITKEYLGQGTHLVGMGNLYEEVLSTDTYRKGEGVTVADVIDGSHHGYWVTGMAGVSNIGTARNWTGHLFGQADWYAFGRMAWDPHEPVDTIYRDWVQMTLTHRPSAENIITSILLNSYEACVQYMTPIGLHHIMAEGHHFGPGPWVDGLSRADWTSVYYHKADTAGLGFDRTSTGSNALGQYARQFRQQYEDMETCPQEFLLWFHHVPWDYRLSGGRTLWEELCYQYNEGVEKVRKFQNQWDKVKPFVDDDQHEQVNMRLEIQLKEAGWWRDACLSYFRTFSGMDIPNVYEQPQHSLKYYQSLSYPYAPGIRPKW